MPETDPRRLRLAELRERLADLSRQGEAAPVGSPERDALAVRYGEVLVKVLALAEELEN